MFLLIMNFGPPLPSSRCPGFTPPEILANFGPIPTFSAVRSTFLVEEEAQNLVFFFLKKRNFGHFWAALSKMSLNFSKFLGRLRRHT